MIDFRYHLVSLVSVFLALAIGIALGAGPLREPIANTLQEQVTELRANRDGLRRDLNTAQDSVANRDAFLSAVEPGLVGEQLGGRTIVIVTLPGADGDTVGPLRQTLTRAGARVAGRVDVQDDWVDPGRQQARDEALNALRSAVPDLPAAGEPPATPPGLSALLARALVTGDLAASEQDDPVGRRVLDGLVDAGLIRIDGDLARRATGAVVLVPGVAQADPGAPAPATPEAQDLAGPAWTALATALDTGSDGVVVLGPASAAGSGGVLANLRDAPELSRLVTTVDTGGTPMGDVTTVLALREQQLGGAGSYGFARGARAPLPAGVATAERGEGS